MKPNPRFDLSRYPVPVSHHLSIWTELADSLNDNGSYCGLSWQIEDRKVNDTHRVLLGGEIGWRFVEMISFRIPTEQGHEGGVLIVGGATIDLCYQRRVLATSLAVASTLILYADTIIDMEREITKRPGFRAGLKDGECHRSKFHV
ncbi:MAG: hypothetical protein EOO77_30340 [Oxalobacteraceae bacterium]|nr:MAG: hypothetical protein EOO77_30340 [Oxalobacteraceae bacterium]